MTSPTPRKAYPLLLSAMMAVPLAILPSAHFTVRFDDETPGLRFRDDPESLFVRSASVFPQEAGQNTYTVLAETIDYLGERFGLVAACPPVPSVDVFRSDFINGNIVITDGAWGFYTEDDLEGGPCPQTTLDPRQPSIYLETIRQKGDFDVKLDLIGIPVLWTPDVTLVQVLVLPVKDGIVLGGTYAAEHGAYELNELDPSDLTSPYDDFLYGTMVLDWHLFKRKIHFESLEPNTTNPAGAKRMTLLLESSDFGTGIFDVVYSAYATEWDADPELTGNPVLGIPRNPILTPSRVNFRYVGTATFPYDPETGVHATCTNDFSDPNNLRICPPDVPQQ